MKLQSAILIKHQLSSGCNVPFWRNVMVKLVMECCFFMTMPSFDKCNIVQATIRKTGFVELNDPAYSPDIAPSDYYLFSNLKKFLRGKNFRRDNETIDRVKDYLNNLDREFFVNPYQVSMTDGGVWSPREDQYIE